VPRFLRLESVFFSNFENTSFLHFFAMSHTFLEQLLTVTFDDGDDDIV